MSPVNIEELFKNPETWDAAFNENGYVDGEHRVTIKEAFGTADAPWLFQKVVARTLKEASEPQQLVVPMLDVIRTDAKVVEIAAVNALQAAHIPEGQEYPEQQLTIEKQVEGKVSKKGVKVAFTDEVINDSQWDIVGLHVRAAGRAMTRLKEQIALQRFKGAAHVVFDNAATPKTTGVGATGTVNNTLTWEDYVVMATVLLAENKSGTDLIMHPLMFPMFLKNFAFDANTSWNINLSNKEAVANATSPLGLNVTLSPFVDFTPAAGSNPAVSDVFLVDRNEVGALLVREDQSVDEWTDLTRDIRYLKLKERYDIVAYGEGEGIAVAKDVALSRNYDITLSRTVA